MKLFVGIDLPEPHRSELARLCDSSRYALQFTKPERLHVTLRFLGEHPAYGIRIIERALSKVRSRLFEVLIQGMDCFSSPPKVLFAGVTSQVLVELKGAVDVALGFKDGTKHYHPHVTLAKPACWTEQREAEKMRDFEGPSLFLPPFLVDRFFLFSNPGDGRPYDKIGEFPLCRSSM